METSSRAFDANERVERYLFAVKDIQENVLVFKGFLGPTLKDNDGLQTVGMRAARAAGVIVDALGKLRCPPGTPNANQFTDMQMSNCMTPSAGSIRETAKKLGARADKLVDGVKDLLTSSNVKNGAKATALVALEYLDFQNQDGMGTLTASVLIGLDLARSAGADISRWAIDTLHDKGRLSDERHAELVEITSKIGDLGKIASSLKLVKKNKKGEPIEKEIAKIDEIKDLGIHGFKNGNPRFAKAKEFDPLIGAADANGRNISHNLPTVKTDIDSRDKAASHIANGGKLNEISDDLVIDAVIDNTDVLDSNGTIKELKRFEVLGTGGGVNGMNRFRDRETGQMFGIKYIDRPNTRYEDLVTQHGIRASGTPRFTDPLNEVFGHMVMEEFGYPSSGLRLVQSNKDLASVGLISDLVHNVYDGEIIAGNDQSGIMNDLSTEKIANIALMDLIMGNTDRHTGNFLYSKNADGVDIAPIDHSYSFDIASAGVTLKDFADLMSNRHFTAMLKQRHGGTQQEHAALVEVMDKISQDIKKIDVDALEKRLKDEFESIKNDQNLIAQLSEPQVDRLAVTDISIDSVIQRLRSAQNASPTELANLFVRESVHDDNDPVDNALIMMAQANGVLLKPGERRHEFAKQQVDAYAKQVRNLAAYYPEFADGFPETAFWRSEDFPDGEMKDSLEVRFGVLYPRNGGKNQTLDFVKQRVGEKVQAMKKLAEIPLERNVV